jgi:simple sugar transport system permease protein
LGNAHRFRLGFSAEYGFTGIAVALVARGSPFGVILSAFLFGALHKGAGDLEMETERMNRDLAMILQAMVLLLATADALFRFKLKSRQKEGGS